MAGTALVIDNDTSNAIIVGIFLRSAAADGAIESGNIYTIDNTFAALAIHNIDSEIILFISGNKLVSVQYALQSNEMS